MIYGARVEKDWTLAPVLQKSTNTETAKTEAKVLPQPLTDLSEESHGTHVMNSRLSFLVLSPTLPPCQSSVSMATAVSSHFPSCCLQETLIALLFTSFFYSAHGPFSAFVQLATPVWSLSSWLMEVNVNTWTVALIMLQ